MSNRTIQANGRTYKPEEFICEWCHTPLVLDTYYHIEGKNVCQSCRNKERCASCGFLITETKYVTVDHLTYHPDCFRCSECLIELHKFHLENGKLFCNECINLQASTNPEDLCGKCYLPLSGGIIKALGKRYHEDCFVCHSCFGPFPNDEFVNISGNPFCDNCVDNKSYLKSTAHIKATGAPPPASTTTTSSTYTSSSSYSSGGAPAGGYGSNPSGSSGYGSSSDRGLPGSGSTSGSGGYGSNSGPGAGGYGSNTGPGAGGYGSNSGPGAGGYGSNSGPGAGGYGSNTGPGAGGYGSNSGPGAGGYGANSGPGAGGYGSNAGPGAGGPGYGSSGGPGYGAGGAPGGPGSNSGPGYGSGANPAPVSRELNAGGLEYGSVNNIPPAPPASAGGPGYGSSGGPGYGAGGAPGGPGSNSGPGYGSSGGPGATGGKQTLVDDDDDDDELDASNLPARTGLGSSKFDQKKKIKIGGGMKEEKQKRDYKSKAALGFAHESEHLKDLESLGYKTIRVKAPPK